MSVLSILGTIGGGSQTPPPPSTTETGGAGGTGTEPAPTDAVQPSQQTGASGDAGSSTANSGSGAGAGGTASQQPLRSNSSLRRPPDAAPISVVRAQTADGRDDDSSPLSLDLARRAAIGLVEKQRTSELIEGLKQAPEVLRIDTSEVAKEMPDPLPTSPFLKRAER